MNIAYFDCFAGVSGDMILGALFGAGLEIDELRSELQKLPLDGYRIESERVTRNGIAGTRAIVKAEEITEHRHLSDIVSIIRSSGLNQRIQSSSIEVFENLAQAEANVHSTSPDKIHFHEVGAVDAIIDIVGAVIGLELLGITKVIASPIALGEGFVNCQHGTIPLPSPATMELVKGLPVRASGLEFEMTTPTGAALLKTLASEFGPIPNMTIENVGYGAGSRELPIPNLLRLVIGQIRNEEAETDSMELLETNIDDMNPEYYEHIMQRLFDVGAVDVWLTPIIMKKTRPAQKLSLLVALENLNAVTEVVLSETTSLGVRRQTVKRRKLPRRQIEVSTPFGKIGIKIASMNGRVCSVVPEYDDCSRAAKDSNVPIRSVFGAAIKLAHEKLELD